MSDIRQEKPVGVSLEQALEQMRAIQERQGSRPFRLAIRISNPGGLTAHQTVEVSQVCVGFDWEAGKLIFEPAQPLTPLTAEQVEAISQSVRQGQSWHAYEREKALRERIAVLEAHLKKDEA
jgi:hypothetical protein